jgi:serine/threonine protein kinase
MELWRSEVDLLARAQGSPYVSRLIGVVLDERGDPEFILTELAAGSLYDTLHDDTADDSEGPRGGRPVSQEEATWMMLNIARGLQYLHDECDPPITHRDLSAKNVLRTSGCLLALTDLGQAKVLRGRGTDTLNPGAEVYASPESLQDGVDQTVQMDIFSFGVLSLEICTGRFPQPGRQFEVVGGGMARVRTQLERRGEHLALMDDANPLKDLVVRCLAEDPVDRPRAGGVVQELEALGAMPQIQEAQAQVAQARQAAEAAERRANAAAAGTVEARRATKAADGRAAAAEGRVGGLEAAVAQAEQLNRDLLAQITAHDQAEGKDNEPAEGKDDNRKCGDVVYRI